MTVTVHLTDITANPEANSWDFFLAPHLPPCGLLLKAPSHHPWLFFHTLFSGPYQHFHHFRNACLSLIFHHTSPVEINEWWVWNSSPFMTKVIIVGPGESDLLTGRWRKLPVPPALWGGWCPGESSPSPGNSGPQYTAGSRVWSPRPSSCPLFPPHRSWVPIEVLDHVILSLVWCQPVTEEAHRRGEVLKSAPDGAWRERVKVQTPLPGQT